MCSFGSLCPLPLLWEGSFFFSPLNLEFDLMLVVVFFFFNSLRYLEFLVNRDLILRIWFYLFILLSFLVAFWGLEDKAFDCLLCYYGCWKRIERKKYSYSILQLARSWSCVSVKLKIDEMYEQPMNIDLSIVSVVYCWVICWFRITST